MNTNEKNSFSHIVKFTFAWLISTKNKTRCIPVGKLRSKITFSHDKSWDSSSGNGGDNSVPLLGNADLTVPPPVGLGGGEHVTTAAHVTESGLAGTVSTTSANTGDTCYSTTGTPRFGTGLVT